MIRLRYSRDVDRAFRALKVAAEKSIKELNRTAGEKIAKGDYSGAETLATKGKELRQLQADIKMLHEKWRATGSSKQTSKGNVTPLWRYFQPILQSLVQRGGEGTPKDVESDVERLFAPSFLAGDKVSMARGRERWRVMIRRARRPLIAEGWIEGADNAVWKITEAGRRAAEQGTES